MRRRRATSIVALTLVAALGASPSGAQKPSAADTVVPLPAPSGRFAVGTATTLLTDSARRDADLPSGRPIMVQLWYPAAHARGARASYLVERGLAAALPRGPYYGMDTATLARWSALRTHAVVDAPVVAGRHPLVTFSVGLGVIRANYTSITEELASHGYVVALVESPLAGFMVLPDGHLVEDTTSRLESAAFHRAAVSAWARDVVFTLDRLKSGRVPLAFTRVARTIDWSRVAAAGHSSGGLVALQACEMDVRVRACIDMDGGFASPTGEPMAEFVAAGTTKPTLLLRSEPDYSDADFARRGLTRAEWEKRNERGRIALDSVTARAHAAFVTAKVRGTGHFSFSDAPFVMPTAISRFGGRIIAPARGLAVIAGTMRAFLEETWGGKRDALAALSARYPELTVTRAGAR